jgi:glycosyltransferase involved in cell wall biosynthesis
VAALPGKAATSGKPEPDRGDLRTSAVRPPLRIAQLAPPAERVPPELYGGTERVVSALTEELVRRGHQVTLFASGDSRTAAKLVPVCPRALRLDALVADVQVYTMRELGLAFAHADEFDIIHNHLDYFALPFTRLTRTPVITTLHGRLDLPDLPMIFGDFPDAPLISVSNSQRTPLRWANWIATVYNGVDLRAYPTIYETPGAYFAFLGRISPEKNIEAAIRIARATGIPLKIAAKVDRADRDYYERIVRPLIDGRFIEYVGEINEEAKNAFLGGAYALLFPVDWPEPFGLAMTEAMACGTPVLALRRGSVPEVVADGVTGFVRDTEAQLITAAQQIPRLDRRRCRQLVEAHFSATAMADGYEAVYRAQLRQRAASPAAHEAEARRHASREWFPTAPEAVPGATTLVNADDPDA